MLKVWGRRSSFNVQKVMWLIGELELPHEHIDAGGAFGGLDTPAFLAMNPHGRVPVIRDDVSDCVGIARDPSLSGRAPRRRAFLVGRSGCARRASTAGWTGRRPRCSRISWSACSGASIERPKTSGTGRRSAPRWRVARRHFEKLERLLEGRSFLLGETLSLADITAGTSLYRYFELEIERPPLPGVERWYRTLQQREAFRTAHHDSVRELRGRLDY